MPVNAINIWERPINTEWEPCYIQTNTTVGKSYVLGAQKKRSHELEYLLGPGFVALVRTWDPPPLGTPWHRVHRTVVGPVLVAPATPSPQ